SKLYLSQRHPRQHVMHMMVMVEMGERTHPKTIADDLFACQKNSSRNSAACQTCPCFPESMVLIFSCTAITLRPTVLSSATFSALARSTLAVVGSYLPCLQQRSGFTPPMTRDVSPMADASFWVRFSTSCATTCLHS